MKRVAMSRTLMNRIYTLMEEAGVASSASRGSDPHAVHAARIAPTSALGRFLARKGWVGVELGCDYGRYYQTITVRETRGALQLAAIAVG